MPALESAEVSCPSCWETIELAVDTSAGDQIYTEDCAVCCQPMRVRLIVGDSGGFTLEVEAENG